MDILGNVMGNFSDEIIGSLAKQAGVDPAIAKTVIDKVAPAMTGAMAKNAAKPGGAEALDKALGSHDGSVLSNPDSVSSAMGQKILGHVFGSATSGVADTVADQVGLDKSTTEKLMGLAAPMVLGSLGKTKKEQSLDAGGLQGMLGTAAVGLSGDSNYMSMAMKFADLDGDGSVVDDLPKIMGFVTKAKKFLGK